MSSSLQRSSKDLSSGPARKTTATHISILDSLEELFKDLTDDELIVEFSVDASLRRFSAKALSGLTSKGGYHQALLYYLRNRRPALLARLDTEAEELAQGWPMNYADLNRRLLVGGWWATSLLKRFRQALRVRMRGQAPGQWVETIWPAAVDILRNYEIRRVANQAERAISEKIQLPSSIHLTETGLPPKTPRGKARTKPANQWLKVKKLLRHQLSSHFKKFPQGEPEA